MEREYTKDGLPIVSMGTINQFEIERKAFESMYPGRGALDTEKAGSAIEEENSNLVDYIFSFGDMLKIKNPRDGFALGFLIGYELLRKELLLRKINSKN